MSKPPESMPDEELEAQMEAEYAAAAERIERGLIVDDTDAEFNELTEEYVQYLERRAAIARRMLARHRAAEQGRVAG